MFCRAMCSCVVLELRRSCAQEHHFRGAGSDGVRFSAEKQLFCSAEQQICRASRGLLNNVAKKVKYLAVEHKRGKKEF
jgi:hypothetical protein